MNYLQCNNHWWRTVIAHHHTQPNHTKPIQIYYNPLLSSVCTVHWVFCARFEQFLPLRQKGFTFDNFAFITIFIWNSSQYPRLDSSQYPKPVSIRFKPVSIGMGMGMIYPESGKSQDHESSAWYSMELFNLLDKKKEKWYFTVHIL